MTRTHAVGPSSLVIRQLEDAPGMPKKILILMSDTGGGHRASAEAIAEATAHLYGDEIRVRIVDAWRSYVPWPLNKIPDTYPWLVSDGLWLWNALWRTDDKAWSPQVVSRVFTPLVRRSAIKLFRTEAPDLVVTVHPIINHIPLRVLRNVLKSDIPYVTVVTDMVTAHPSWFCPDVDYCMVPTEAARQRALRYGMQPDRVEVVGQPVGLEFAAGVGEEPCLRRKLGIDPDRPAVLIVGGGEGVGPVYETARAIAAGVSDAQLIIVAGRNAALQQQLDATIWEIPAQVYGFATNMPELMGASDVLVTKAGPGTLSEAFIAGLPVIISGFIPGQEEGNVHYVLEHQAGAYAPGPTKIVSLIRKWLQPDDDTLKQMATNAAALARPEAAVTIAQRLHRLLITEHASRPLSARVDTSFAPSGTASCAATCQKEPEKRGESWQTHYP
jgi:1,2-diacylglycerol 3-beta-galactosyltransferase